MVGVVDGSVVEVGAETRLSLSSLDRGSHRASMSQRWSELSTVFTGVDGVDAAEVAAVDVIGVGDAETGGAAVAGDADVVAVAGAKTEGRVIGVGDGDCNRRRGRKCLSAGCICRFICPPGPKEEHEEPAGQDQEKAR